jgi:TonB-dependent SusC/RagA subfamily outer membrane receptor
MKRSILSLAFACTAADLGAQACTFGPGEVLGIVAYQCANCGFKRETPERPTYLFYAEPVVLEAKSPGVFKAGDVVEAVDGKPITTSAGAEQFTYPGVGEHSITVRRGRDREVLRVSLSEPAGNCAAPKGPPRVAAYSWDKIERIETIKGPAAIAKYGPDAANGVMLITTTGNDARAPGGKVALQLPSLVPKGAAQPLIIIDGVVEPRPGDPNSAFQFTDARGRVNRFGFAVSCVPCTAATTKEGTLHYTYYPYDRSPPVVAIRPDGPAEKAGLKVGDVVIKADGQPVTEEAGARILAKLDRQDRLNLTVLRGDKELVIKIEP